MNLDQPLPQAAHLPLLSILIPVHNTSAYLDCLLAAFEAADNEVELVFVNDASTDDALTKLQLWQQRHPALQIHIINLLQNEGIPAVRRKLWQASRGEYIWYVDSDDVVRSDALAEIMARLRANQPDVLLFDYAVFTDGESGKPKEEHLGLPANKLLPNQRHLLYRQAVLDGKHYFWNKVFKRCVLANRIDFTIPASEDIAYSPIWLFYCRHFFYLPESLLSYRIHPTSVTQKMSVKQVYGLQAYADQAQFCQSHVGGDDIAYAYLLYKACTYYYRIQKKLALPDLGAQSRQEVGQALYAIWCRTGINPRQTAVLLVRRGMYAKALKLISLYWRHRKWRPEC